MSDLDTVQFDEESSDGDDLNERKHFNLVTNLKPKNIQYSSANVLLEALIHQICRYVESDPAKQKRLFIVICDKLHELHLLGKSYKLEELQYLRERYMNILQKLIVAAKCLVDIDVPNEKCEDTGIPIDTHIQSLRGKLFDWSRYAHEFREVDFIARGGFGQVYKAHNILDDCDYAVKKISLKYHKIDSFVQSLREVQTLAKLNHPNIVAYKAAWLEPFDSRKHVRAGPKPRIQEIRPRLPVSEAQDIENLRPNTRLHMIEEIKTESKQFSNSFEIEFKDSSASDSVVDFKNSNSDNHKSDTSEKQIEPRNLENDDIHHGIKSKHNTIESSDSSSSLHICRLDIKSVASNGIIERSEVSPQNNARYCQNHVSKVSQKNTKYWHRKSKELNEASLQNENTSSHIDNEQIVPVRQMGSRLQEIHNLNYFFPESQTVSMDWVTLYIQMQLCQLTLKEWLSCASYDSINSSLYDSQVLYIFKQIVQGLDYIHAQGIVHHDIKPSNIFVSHDLKSVQVGDFGLACCLLPHSPHEGGYSVITAPRRSEHPLGTRLYAAPEQLHGLCDPKSDVYSLGIVLFEMLINFSTNMEKSKEITKLKMGQMPPRVASQYPHYAKIITKLLDVNPKHRPSASQILMYLDSYLMRSRLNSDSSLEDEHVEHRWSTDSIDNTQRVSEEKDPVIEAKDAIIEELKVELMRKKDEIEALQNRIKQLEGNKS